MEKSGDTAVADFPHGPSLGTGIFRERGLCQYQLVINPPREILQHLEEEQAYANQAFGAGIFSKGPWQLLLASFMAKEEMEETLLRWLHRIIGQQEAFPVCFNNYGSMPGYPLYVRVQDPGPFRGLAEGLRIIDGLLKGNGCPGIEINHHPRILLAPQIDPRQEMEVLLDFSGRTFRAVMEVEEIGLLKESSPAGDKGLVSRLMLSPKGLNRTDHYGNKD
jgi:hypothetical protein